MKVDLPCLTVGVRLDEMTLVVNMKSMLSDVVFEVGYEALKVYDCHDSSLPRNARDSSRLTWRGVLPT